MKLRNEILGIIEDKTYQGMDLKELSIRLQMEDSASFTQLCKELNAMEDASILFQDEKHRYFTAEQKGYFKGILRINAKGFGFVEQEEESVYIGKDHIGLAMPNDIVVAMVWTNHDGSKEGKIEKILEHGTKNLVGTIKKKQGKTYFLPDSNFHHRRFQITNLHEFHLVNDTKVLIQIDRYEKVLQAHIIKEVGYKYDPGVDILSILYEHDIWPEFPEEVMKEVHKIPDHVLEEDKVGRRNLTNEMIITIDGDDARDLDDAVSITLLENDVYRLGVHIADVSYYVREGMAVNAEAFERGTSVYVTDRVVPMLPHALSNGICSLNPRVERCTITCQMDIDAQGEVIQYEIYPSYIKTIERMTYKKVNEILAHKEKTCQEYAHITDMCYAMEELSKRIRRRREQLGAIDFDTKEAKIIVDEQGKPVDVVLRERGIAERIIEDFMIAANETVAAHLKWMDIPGIYRVHETPEPKKMREFAHVASVLGFPLKGDMQKVYPKQLQQLLQAAKKDEAYPVLSTFMLRSMQKARYADQCLGHFGLALQEYLHFTSPIRRYPDLIVHRMLRKYCFTKEADFHKMEKDQKWMKPCSDQCSLRERRAVDAERDVEDMKKAEYMENFIGEVYEGVISGITNFGLFVELENTIEGLVHVSTMKDDYYHYDEKGKCFYGEHTGRQYRMGQKVIVRVESANRFERQIDFILITKDVIVPKKQKQKKKQKHLGKRYDHRSRSRKKGGNYGKSHRL